LNATITEAARVAGDASAPAPRRARAVALLALTNDPAGEAALLALVAPEQPPELAVTAARALAQPQRAATSLPKLLEAQRWARYSPALRSTVLASVVGRPPLAPALVDAIESGAVPAASLSEPQRDWLKGAGDDKLKARAAKLLAGNTSEDRKKAFEDAKAVLSLKPDPARGQKVFMAQCSSCHRLEREGYAVGPDLYGIRSQPKESILLHIVIPEQEIAPNFTAYDCVLTDGRTITGIMTADSPSSVTLKQVLGLEETVPRDKIKSLTVSKSSLMPQGLEKAMKPQELADLLAYLRGEK
jgi:putative heme-binding domain-containing protein